MLFKTSQRPKLTIKKTSKYQTRHFFSTMAEGCKSVMLSYLWRHFGAAYHCVPHNHKYPPHVDPYMVLFDWNPIAWRMDTENADWKKKKNTDKEAASDDFGDLEEDTRTEEEIKEQEKFERFKTWNQLVTEMYTEASSAFGNKAKVVVLCADSSCNRKYVPKDRERLKRDSVFSSELTEEQLAFPFKWKDPFTVPWNLVMRSELFRRMKREFVRALLMHKSVPEKKRLFLDGFFDSSDDLLDQNEMTELFNKHPDVMHFSYLDDDPNTCTKSKVLVEYSKMELPDDNCKIIRRCTNTSPLCNANSEGEQAMASWLTCSIAPRRNTPKKKEDKVILMVGSDTDLLVLGLQWLNLFAIADQEEENTWDVGDLKFKAKLFFKTRSMIVKKTAQKAPPPSDYADQGITSDDVEDADVFTDVNHLYFALFEKLGKRHEMMLTFVFVCMMGSHDFYHGINGFAHDLILDVFLSNWEYIKCIVSCNAKPGSRIGKEDFQYSAEAYMRLLKCLYYRKVVKKDLNFQHAWKRYSLTDMANLLDKKSQCLKELRLLVPKTVKRQDAEQASQQLKDHQLWTSNSAITDQLYQFSSLPEAVPWIDKLEKGTPTEQRMANLIRKYSEKISAKLQVFSYRKSLSVWTLDELHEHFRRVQYRLLYNLYSANNRISDLPDARTYGYYKIRIADNGQKVLLNDEEKDHAYLLPNNTVLVCNSDGKIKCVPFRRRIKGSNNNMTPLVCEQV